jgi:CYTH domain-containing protein
MGLEIERKFIVPLEHHALFLGLPPGIKQRDMTQAYLSSEKGKTVRLRIERSEVYPPFCWITIKGTSSDGGLTRSEWEAEFPVQAAEEILTTLNPPRLHKTRNFVQHGDDVWAVDVLKVNTVADRPPMIWKYLVVAEFEHHEPEKVKNVVFPPWVGKEVTGDSRFAMVNLVTEAQRDAAWLAAYRP